MNPVALVLHKEFLPFLNIGMYLNNIPFIQSLVVENTSDADKNNIVIKITLDIPCIETFEYNCALIPAGKSMQIPLDGLKINRLFLNQITESEKARIKIEILENGLPAIVVEEFIRIHPAAYFSGFQVLPELIAAYVMPNHPYVYHILRNAVAILEKQHLSTSFEGYQRDDPERVLQMMSAIYSAIAEEQIVYSALPPGYEIMGQRLRLSDTIRTEHFGNCIDISLLFAACLEAVNLNPLIVITLGHAFVGCWLTDGKFSEVINDDKTAITKRLAQGIREIAVVEATTVCKGSNTLFTQALNIGESQLIEKEDFILSVDIKRARTLRIRPLSLLSETENAEPENPDSLQRASSTAESKFEIGTIYQEEDLGSKTKLTKQKIWERKLLDLSLRNNLLNIRMTRNMLQLVDIDISHLEDTLADGKTFSILPSANAEILRKYNLFCQKLHTSSPLYQMANDELKYNRLLTYYHQQDLDNILTYIHKNAKQAIEESGSSTMYLAVGLLKWYDRKTPEQPRFAPILLLPVEISRRSVKSRFMLKSREEETMINITLLEFLRQEYELDLRGLEQLPTDDKGVDVKKVMATLRRAVMQLKGWDVEEQLILGNFSFSKLILWQDIVVHQEALLKSAVVRSLVEGKLVNADGVGDDTGIINPNNIHPASVALPVATDVSQLQAMTTAQQGKSFVLHGPPGTGKSQTITNIIADALYRGKKVLFVAAKKAALEVVQKRLEQTGLAPFVLELHSNKSKKSDVLQQLAASLEVVKRNNEDSFAQEAERLNVIKNDISRYVDALHQKQPVGWNLYESLTHLQTFNENAFIKIPIPENITEQLDTLLCQKWEDWLPQFQSIIQIINHPQDNALSHFTITAYSQQLQNNIETLTQQLLQLFHAQKETIGVLEAIVHLTFRIKDFDDWIRLEELVGQLASLPEIPSSFCLFLSDKANRNMFDEWIKYHKQYCEVLQTLLNDYERSIADTDVTPLALQWKQAQQSWFLPRWMKKNKVRKQLIVYRKTKFNYDDEISLLFQQHNQLQEVRRMLQQQRFLPVTESLSYLYKEEATDTSQLENNAQSIASLKALMNEWQDDALCHWITANANRRSENIFTSSEKKCFEDFLAQASQLKKLLAAYAEVTGWDIKQSKNEQDWVAGCAAHLESIEQGLNGLKDWVKYTIIKNNGNAIHLQWLTEAFEKRIFQVQKATPFFYYTVHNNIAEQVINRHESLSLFTAGIYEQKVEQYKKLSGGFRDITKQELLQKLSAQLPDTTREAMHSSEIGILQRAIKNRGRGISIRRLFDQIPTLLPRIKPCMLMSPMSVAQYFDVNDDHFDMVIFDEASQLPTCEAVSALSRAKQAIIVGDPKQMPPTSFFSSSKIDEENIDVEDLESILDDCLALSMPSRYLLRHYRSRHESLIAFSNANYYENKLLTFPSSDDLNRKVIHHRVQGFYDKGKTRQNKFEADAIIEFIQKHYSHPSKKYQSLGVITFSQTQQSLIEDKLQQLFMQHTDVEQAANECAETLFVKNLENVQGDERDVILFSIGYAPDEEDKMSMNFGPLNRDGGWRRLNVAITRARDEMHIFATLPSDRIDLNRTAAEGVAGLKGFLNFAEKGTLPVRPEYLADTKRQSLSVFIAQKLEAKGLKVKTNIGASSFKVDIGILHPDKPQQYILGVMLDGKFYYEAQTANDRETVMPAVLKGLGWNIFRIWTMDWVEHSKKIVSTIVEEVERLRTAEPVIIVPEIPTTKSNKKDEQEAIAGEEENISNATTTAETLYQAYSGSVLLPVANGNSETIYEFRNRKLLQEQIREVINTEAPVSKSLLYKRVLQAWNTSRAGARLDTHLSDIIADMNLKQIKHHQPFYWQEDQDAGNFTKYRVNGADKRNFEDIAPEELSAAITEAVQQNLSIEEEELLRYIAKLFGFAKVGRQIEGLLRYAVDMTVKKGKVRRENGRVKV